MQWQLIFLAVVFLTLTTTHTCVVAFLQPPNPFTSMLETPGGGSGVSLPFMVPMRDGVRLYTVVTWPDVSTRKRSVVLERTPYGTKGLSGLASTWNKQGFIYVGQDFRGRYQSEGNYSFWSHGTEDADDTIAWINKQDWSNGHVFGSGTSANGIAAYMEIGQLQPAMRGQFVIVGSPNMYGTAYQGGALRQSLVQLWLNGIQESWYYDAVIKQNEAYNAFWASMDMTTHYKNAWFPAIHYTGWYDIFQFSSIDAYRGYNTNGSALAPNNQIIFIDGLGHCGGGQFPFPNTRAMVAVAFAAAAELFKVDGAPSSSSSLSVGKATFYVMGPKDAAGAPNGNYWSSSPVFPPAGAKLVRMYLDASASGGKLVETMPTSMANRTFVYNPANPLSTLGGNNLILPTCGPWDQTPLYKNRSDILLFTSAPFTSPMAIAGRVSVVLFVASNATDTDFTAQWQDVYPTGERVLIQDGIQRMRWRSSNTRPECMEPSRVYEISVDLQYTAFIVNPGHALGVAVSSSNSPRFSVNPNTCQPVNSTSTVNITAANTVFTGGANTLSYLQIPVVDSLPPIAVPMV